MIRAGMDVIITGDAGTVRAHIEEVHPAAELPAIAEAPDPRAVAALLDEHEVDTIAAVSYWHAQFGHILFHALHRSRDDQWFDLRYQPITLTPAEDNQ